MYHYRMNDLTALGLATWEDLPKIVDVSEMEFGRFIHDVKDFMRFNFLGFSLTLKNYGAMLVTTVVQPDVIANALQQNKIKVPVRVSAVSDLYVQESQWTNNTNVIATGAGVKKGIGRRGTKIINWRVPRQHRTNHSQVTSLLDVQDIGQLDLLYLTGRVNDFSVIPDQALDKALLTYPKSYGIYFDNIPSLGAITQTNIQRTIDFTVETIAIWWFAGYGYRQSAYGS